MVPRPFHSDRDVSRRQILLSTGAFLAGGGAVAALSSDRAQGSVTTRELSIPPAEYEGENGTVADLHLDAVGNYEFSVPEGDTLTLTLAVAPDDTDNPDYQPIDTSTESISTTSGAGQYTLSGSMLDHPALEAAQFSADPEETVTNRVPVRVLLEVTKGDERVVAAAAQAVARVEVTNTSIEASAAVIAEGEISVEV